MALVGVRGYIFIHIYKCGGTSLREILKNDITFNILKSHSTALEVKKYFYEKKVFDYFNNSFIFSFIRNPFEWTVSLFNFIKYNVEHENYNEIKEYDFDDFCKWIVKAIAIKKQNTNGTYNTLTEFLYDNENNLLVDFVGRIENYEHDIKQIAKIINIDINEIPKLNKNKIQSDYKLYYNPDTKTIIEKLFKKDLENFNYSF